MDTMTDQTPDPIDVLLSTTINWNLADRTRDDDPHKEHNYSGSCALCRMDRPESLPAIFAALADAGFELRPVVDDATRQEVEKLIEAIKAMRPDPSEPAPPGWDADDREGDRNIYRAAELLAAAYLGKGD